MLRNLACLLTTFATLLACGEEQPSPSAGRAGAASAGTSAGGADSANGMAGASGGGSGGAGAGGGGSGGAGAVSSTAGGAAGLGGAGHAGGGAGAGGQAVLLVGLGSISYERWLDIKGEAVTLVPTSEPPDVTMQLDAFQMPDDVGQDFAARVRGFLTAPETGTYTFRSRATTTAS